MLKYRAETPLTTEILNQHFTGATRDTIIRNPEPVTREFETSYYRNESSILILCSRERKDEWKWEMQLFGSNEAIKSFWGMLLILRYICGAAVDSKTWGVPEEFIQILKDAQVTVEKCILEYLEYAGKPMNEHVKMFTKEA